MRHADSHRRIYSGLVGRESAPVLKRCMQRWFARLFAHDLARRWHPGPDAVRGAALVGALRAMPVTWIERCHGATGGWCAGGPGVRTIEPGVVRNKRGLAKHRAECLASDLWRLSYG